MRPIFCFDVESNGLHGDGFAFGAVRLNDDGVVVARWSARGPLPDPCDAWVAKNVLPALPERDWTKVMPGLRSLRACFWDVYLEHGADALVVVDCGWPVEARFLAACVDDVPERAKDAPYPLHDLATLYLAAGLDPTARYPLPPGKSVEGRPHNPRYDAEVSALQAYELLRRLEKRR